MTTVMTTADPEQLKTEALAAIDAADTLDALEAVRVEALGKSGSVSAVMKTLGKMDPDERKVMGPKLNALKTEITEAITQKKTALEDAALEAELAAKALDLSLPGPDVRTGTVHPTSQVFAELTEIFANMGFAVAEGPDIEDDFHNFTALNFPPDHPARDHHDTFFFSADDQGERKLLRTHTSPVQIRTMLSEKPPLRIIAPGRTYRCDSDQTHTPMFHQLEGLVIDKGVHMGHLKGCLMDFVKAFFEVDDVEVRFRPHHFPFTEPSAEMDIGYSRDGQVLKIGTGDSWLEILGCGMVHPNVLKACNLDPNDWQGFAFGLGVDRLAMLKYGIPDLRAFFDNDQRWLKHYGFSPLHQPSTATGLS